jgi:hypothetical protein
MQPERFVFKIRETDDFREDGFSKVDLHIMEQYMKLPAFEFLRCRSGFGCRRSLSDHISPIARVYHRRSDHLSTGTLTML